MPVELEVGVTVVDDTVATPEAASSVVLRAVDITKTFDGLLALKGVDFDIRAGDVTVLFGENGAGKSTLMKILAGVYGPTTGHLELDGEEVAFKSTIDAAAHGIAIIHQELSLCPNLSVRDNIFLGREVRTRRLFVDDSAEEAASDRAAAPGSRSACRRRRSSRTCASASSRSSRSPAPSPARRAC